jgi:hypothetical protein
MNEYEIVSKTNGRYHMPSAIYIFRNGLLTDFVCLYTYEFCLSLCKIVRSSVILLLPLLASPWSCGSCQDVFAPDLLVPVRMSLLQILWFLSGCLCSRSCGSCQDVFAPDLVVPVRMPLLQILWFLSGCLRSRSCGSCQDAFAPDLVVLIRMSSLQIQINHPLQK